MKVSTAPLKKTTPYSSIVWLATLLIFSAFISGVVYLYLALQRDIWQLYVLTIINLVIITACLFSIKLSKQNRINVAAQLIIAIFIIAIPTVSLLIANISLVVGLGLTAFMIFIANTVLPKQQIIIVFIMGIIATGIAMCFNWFQIGWPVFIPQLQTFIPSLIGIVVILMSFMVVQESKQRRQVEAQLLIKQQEMAKVNAQLQQELEKAYQIQQSFLPPSHPGWQQLDIVCYNQPAKEVGGDFYAYYQFKDKHFAVAIGDVTGKGVAAALLMAICVTQFDIVAGQELGPTNFLVKLDTFLTRYTQQTHQNCALCYLEIEDQTLRIVNAGGIPPYILRANGTVEEIDVGGLPLGLGLATADGYSTFSTLLAPQDMIILVSDGIVEANAKTNDLFGFDRLAQTIANGPATSSQAMLDYLNSQLLAFTGNAEQHDDLTIMVVQIR